MRDFSTALLNALESNSLNLIYFIEVEVDLTSSPEQVLRLHTQLGTYSFDSKTWTGAGSLLSIDNLQETVKMNPAPLRLTLSGMSTDVTEIFFNANHFQSPVKMYTGLLSGGTLVDDPHLVFSGFLQKMTMEQGTEGGDIINAVADSELILLKRTRNVRYTDRQLQSEYSGDRGLEYLEFVATSKITWRGKDNPMGSSGSSGIPTNPGILGPFNF